MVGLSRTDVSIAMTITNHYITNISNNTNTILNMYHKTVCLLLWKLLQKNEEYIETVTYLQGVWDRLLPSTYKYMLWPASSIRKRR